MKPLYCVIGTLVLQIPSLAAATIQKAGDLATPSAAVNPLNSTAAWVGGVVPGSADIALFTTPNLTLESSYNFATGASLNLGQIALNIQPVTTNSAVTINNNTINLYSVDGIGLNNLSFQPPTFGNKDATLQINSAVNVVNSQTWQAVARGINVYGVISGGSGVTVTKTGGGAVIIGNNSSANINTLAGSFVVGGTNSTTFNTRFSSLSNLTLAGGTTTLNQNQTYTGYTGVNQINSTATLTMASGNLTITGKSGVAVSQTFASTSLREGATTVALNNQATGTGNSVTLNLGAITRTAGGTMNFTSSGTGTATLGTTSGSASSILKTAGGSAFATIGSAAATNWAAKDAGNTNLVAFTGYTTVSGSTLNSSSNGADVNVTTAGNVAVTNAALGTLRIADTGGARSINITAGNTLSTGGILSAAAAGSNINGGSLTALAGTQDLVVINNGGQVSIGSTITNNAGGAVSFTTGGTGTINITGVNTYTGDTYVGSGTLRMNSNTAGNVNSTYHVGGTAILNINNQNTVSIGGLTGYGSITLGSGSVNVGANNTSNTFDGNITGTATAVFTKSGTGTLRLTSYNATNVNNYTGAVAVTGGTLLVNGSLANASSTSVSSGATLGGTGTVGGAATISGNHAPGDGGIGNQTFSGSLTYNSGSTFSWQLGDETPAANFDTVDVGGALNIAASGATFNVIVSGLDIAGNFWMNDRSWDIFDSASAGAGNFDSFVLYDAASPASPVNYSNYGSFTFAPVTGILSWNSAVPEPTNALAGLLIGAGLLRRRRSVKK